MFIVTEHVEREELTIMPLQTKRIYNRPSRGDGLRVLVDRIWPRGVKKQDAQIDQWLKELAPTPELRKWFNHEPEKWDDFKQRYFHELDRHRGTVEELAKKTRRGQVTLLFGAKDTEHNNAVALEEYLKHRRH